MARLLGALLGGIAAIVLVAVVVRLFDASTAPPIVIEEAPAAEIVVEVVGAVATPGVYRLPTDARQGDAVAAAGGLRADADVAAVNLARRLRDEERLVVPTIGPAAPAAPDSAGTEGVAGGVEPTGAAGAAAVPVNINTATVEQLETLPRIGPALAARIVAYREERGPFRSVEDLAAVEGISPQMVDELRSLVTVGP